MMTTPNFLVIGDLKAGSTSIYHYLRQHPDIYMPAEMKELRYFAYDSENPYHQRTSTFPVHSFDEYLEYFRAVRRETAIGEASPNYLRSLTAARNIFETLPEVRIIASLRNPADRLYSQYLMAVRAGRTTKPFDEDIFGRDAAAIKAGFYWLDLKRYYDLFPRNRIRVVLFDDLKKRTKHVVCELYDFLGVRTDFLPDLSVQNEGGAPRNPRTFALLNSTKKHLRNLGSPPPSLSRLWRRFERSSVRPVAVDPQIRRKILELCRDDTLRTQDLIGQDLSGWM